jgi:hypothetical protein
MRVFSLVIPSGNVLRWRMNIARDLQFESLSPSFRQILPRGILRLNQRQTPRPRPRLNLLLSCNRISNLVKYYVVHETIDLVPFREAFDFSALVLERSSMDAVCDSCVEVRIAAIATHVATAIVPRTKRLPAMNTSPCMLGN